VDGAFGGRDNGGEGRQEGRFDGLMGDSEHWETLSRSWCNSDDELLLLLLLSLSSFVDSLPLPLFPSAQPSPTRSGAAQPSSECNPDWPPKVWVVAVCLAAPRPACRLATWRE